MTIAYGYLLYMRDMYSLPIQMIVSIGISCFKLFCKLIYFVYV